MKGKAEVLVVIAIVVIAFTIRVVQIENVPAGMHGDEASNALVGLQMLHDWDFSPLTSIAAGMPTWPTLLYAISIEMLGRTLFAVRIVSVAEGTLTVLVLYVLVRHHFGWKSALAAALLLAGSEWHIHLTRVAFPLSGWPLAALIESWALLKAIETKKLQWWAMAGFSLAVGAYVYSTHFVLIGVFSLFVTCWVVREKFSKHSLAASLIYGICVSIALLPMVLFALNPDSNFLEHFSQASLSNTPEWQQQDTSGKVQLVWTRYQDWWDHACCRSGERDFIDEVGTTPILDVPVLLLAAVGIVFGVKRRSALTVLGVLIIVLMPMAAAMTSGSGYARRTLVLLPFMMVFAGVGFAEAIQAVYRWPRVQLATAALGAILIAAVVVQNLDDYFVKFSTVANEENLFNRDHSMAVKWMKQLPKECYVEFMSAKRPLRYEVTLFFFPEVRGEDSSAEFGGRFSTQPDRTHGRPVWVLLDQYRTRLDEVRRANPGGVTEVNGNPGNPLFIAYGFPPCVERGAGP